MSCDPRVRYGTTETRSDTCGGTCSAVSGGGPTGQDERSRGGEVGAPRAAGCPSAHRDRSSALPRLRERRRVAAHGGLQTGESRGRHEDDALRVRAAAVPVRGAL